MTLARGRPIPDGHDAPGPTFLRCGNAASVAAQKARMVPAEKGRYEVHRATGNVSMAISLRQAHRMDGLWAGGRRPALTADMRQPDPTIGDARGQPTTRRPA